MLRNFGASLWSVIRWGNRWAGRPAGQARRLSYPSWVFAGLVGLWLVGRPCLGEVAAGLRFEGLRGGAMTLVGPDDRQQLLVTAVRPDGGEQDLTRAVAYAVAPAGIVEVDRAGMIVPRGNGSAKLTVTDGEGSQATLGVTVRDFSAIQQMNFANQIVPIFTKTGCNAGGCHGKSGGQNGFRLSLLGFEPAEDYEYLVKEARGRRVFPAAPERSLLLEKATATLPHGGGKRFGVESSDYRLLERWIAQGMPYGSANDPSVARIEVFPKERSMRLASEQQLKVLAHYTDGSAADVTREALFEPNDKDLGKVSETGLVTVFERPGDVAVMVRYQSFAAVFRAMIPLGVPVTELPPVQNFVDELAFAKLKKMGLPPSPLSDDGSFLRRVTLDIAGRLPTVEETRRFLAETDSSKRDRWIEALLGSGEYADFFANKWSALLRNRRTAEQQTRGSYAFHAWIRDSLYQNKPFDRFVTEILTASGDMSENPPVAWYRQVRSTTAQLEDTAQLFLGQRLQCAQCHHHPFEKWSQQDYFAFGAFFSQVGRRPGSQPGEEMIFHKRGLASSTHAKTKKPVAPAGLGAVPPKLAPDADPRAELARWLAGKENPFFSRALVNRYWKHFFNRGLVDPEDDLRETNPPVNAELLDALAAYFVESGYDLKGLVRLITRSSTYQLSSMPNEHNQLDRQNFSRYYPRRLPAEVLLDAVDQVVLAQTSFDGLPRGTRAVQLPDNSYNANSYFLTVFGRPEMASSCECERSSDASLAQSLHLINSKDIQAKLSADEGRVARLAQDARPDEQKMEELYLLALGRPPTPAELASAGGYLTRAPAASGEIAPGAAVAAKRRGYEDILWALLSTKEFLFNH